VNILVPKIDQLAGIECYCSDFNGIGGNIRQNNEAFRVSEIINESLINGLSSIQDEQHKYPLYILHKKNIDSNHALIEIEKELGIKIKVIGIKDAKAVTKQYATSEQIKKIPRQARTTHTILTLKGFTENPLGKSSLYMNEFTITINNPKFSDVSPFVTQIDKIANFYGLQRFGSERLVTHLVGKEIIKRDFMRAVELLLCYTTEFDTQMSREIRIR